MAMIDSAHHWRPIDLPPDPASLALPEMRAFTKLWERQQQRLQGRAVIQRFQEKMARWWSIETGVIERVYDLSEGATLLLIEQGFIASLIAHGDTNIDPDLLVTILGDHRESLHMVMDLVGGARRLSVGWIRELHALMMQHQQSTTARTPDGTWIDVPLRKGEFKRWPNNPQRIDGLLHEYCPPEQTASEMDRLIALYDSLPPELPEVRSAWLHHAFTQIHPFQDGNGRVARALASIDFIRARLFPVVVARADRSAYLDALGRADQGELAALVRFFARCEERALTRAISEAEVVLGETEGMAAVLQAARAKVEHRGAIPSSARDTMLERITRYAEDARDALIDTAREVEKTVPGVTAEVTGGQQLQRYWFRAQLTTIADRHDYRVDLREPRRFARLQLRDGGVTDVVIVLHFVGDPSPGTCVAIVFLDHRDPDEAFGSSPPIELAVEPLLLAAEEDAAAQRERFRSWLDGARVQALAQWTRFL